MSKACAPGAFCPSHATVSPENDSRPLIRLSFGRVLPRRFIVGDLWVMVRRGPCARDRGGACYLGFDSSHGEDER